MKTILGSLVFLIGLKIGAQLPDHIYTDNIRSVKLFKQGDIYSYPVLTLGSTEQLELHFDDMDGDLKYYYYSFQLCDADWKPANVQSFDYIKGFQSNRISNYRTSSLVPVRYTHYQALLPERNSAPTKAGNYLLKVFLNNESSGPVFTKRLLIVSNKASVSAQVSQPFSGAYFQTHQRLQIGVTTKANQINTFSPQDLKLVVVQNNIWANASMLDRPSVFRGNYFEYIDEEKTTFPAGKEWRWVDLRSLRLMSERVRKIEDSDTSNRVDVYVAPDVDRTGQVYLYYGDLNGIYTLENRDNPNPYWQSDYAWVHFTFVPPGNRPIQGRNIYLFGELTNYEQNDKSKMVFNEEKGVYEIALYLKQGYYNYSYVTVNDRGASVSYENTEGNFWGTENGYMVLVYFRPFGARTDELIGFARVNSAGVR